MTMSGYLIGENDDGSVCVFITWPSGGCCVIEFEAWEVARMRARASA